MSEQKNVSLARQIAVVQEVCCMRAAEEFLAGLELWGSKDDTLEVWMSVLDTLKQVSMRSVEDWRPLPESE
jgi:hypothetical protein